VKEERRVFFFFLFALFFLSFWLVGMIGCLVLLPSVAGYYSLTDIQLLGQGNRQSPSSPSLTAHENIRLCVRGAFGL
jgi:hypothetical protein